MRILACLKGSIFVRDATDQSVKLVHPLKSKSILKISKINCIECVGTAMYNHSF